MNKLLDEDDDITSNLSASTKRNKSYKNKEFTYNSALNEEEIQLKMLENLQPRKYKRDYVEKFVTLLHESKSLKHKYSFSSVCKADKSPAYLYFGILKRIL